jgi:hypothetical protein
MCKQSLAETQLLMLVGIDSDTDNLSSSYNTILTLFLKGKL